MGRAEEVKLLVKVGERLGTIVEARVDAWIGVEVYHGGSCTLECRDEGVPERGRRPQDRTKSWRLAAAAIAKPCADHKEVRRGDELELPQGLQHDALRGHCPTYRPPRQICASCSQLLYSCLEQLDGELPPELEGLMHDLECYLVGV